MTVSDQDDFVLELADAAAELTDHEFKAFFRLRDYQRSRGRALPPRERNLAVIAGVSLQSWRGMRHAIADFLGDVALAEREGPIDPYAGKDPVKVEAGRKGARTRWAQQQNDGKPGGSAIGSAKRPIAETIAKPMADGMAGSHPASHSEPRTERVNEGTSAIPSDSKTLPSFTPSDPSASVSVPSDDGRSDSSAGSKPDGTRDGGAEALLTLVTATGTGAASSKRPIVVVMPTVEEVEDAMRVGARTADGKPHLAGDWRRAVYVDTVRGWISEGFSLRDDYVPALQSFAKGSKEPVGHPANKAVRRIMENKRRERDAASFRDDAASRKPFFDETTPLFRALEASLKKRGKVGLKRHHSAQHGDVPGWWLLPKWPPDIDPAEYLPPGLTLEAYLRPFGSDNADAAADSVPRGRTLKTATG